MVVLKVLWRYFDTAFCPMECSSSANFSQYTKMHKTFLRLLPAMVRVKKALCTIVSTFSVSGPPPSTFLANSPHSNMSNIPFSLNAATVRRTTITLCLTMSVATSLTSTNLLPYDLSGGFAILCVLTALSSLLW